MTQQLERTIRCTPDNEAEFRAAIKSDPHLLQLMKGLQAQGVFPGLRAVTLTVTGDAMLKPLRVAWPRCTHPNNPHEKSPHPTQFVQPLARNNVRRSAQRSSGCQSEKVLSGLGKSGCAEALNFSRLRGRGIGNLGAVVGVL